LSHIPRLRWGFSGVYRLQCEEEYHNAGKEVRIGATIVIVVGRRGQETEEVRTHKPQGFFSEVV
jgi:hypothetical protein